MKKQDNIGNPYEIIFNRFDALEKKMNHIYKLIDSQPEKLYTIKEAATILKMHPNTLRRHVERGTIDADTSRYPIVIKHSDIFDENGTIKQLKYKHY